MNDMTKQAVPSAFNYINRRSPAIEMDAGILEARAELRALLTRLEQLVVPEKVEIMTKLGEVFDRFAVQVSLIGQVKAGKTALSNALLSRSDLLPSDINPWTSVVTSVHLNQRAPRNKNAIFRFFTREEWQGMVETGGRIAAMASKADLETEAEELRAQIVDMQRKTVQRLGKNFELLLGNQHAFSEFSGDLIKRYVCLGDEGAEDDPEGRFADMTRSADLYLDSDLFAYPMTIIDTPGVNDPFLVREAVTLDSLGESDICVIVLSAHQALSTSDLALMRILLNLKQNQIVLFINRIDELAQPQAQIEEIRDRILETLRAQNLPESVPIVFGSAAWADAHVTQSIDTLPPSSADTLARLIATHDGEGAVDLSGMTALQEVLDHKAVVEICAPFYADVANVALSVGQQSKSLLNRAATTTEKVRPAIDPMKIDGELEALRSALEKKFAEIEEDAAQTIRTEYNTLFQEFVFNESRQLVRHLDSKGKLSEWSFDTDALRRKLNACFVGVSGAMQTQFEELARITYERTVQLYENCSEEDPETLGLRTPMIDEPGMPIALMRTMSIDVSTNWLAGWLARRLRRESYLEKFRVAANTQMEATTQEIETSGVVAYGRKAKSEILAFLDSHQFAIQEMLGLTDHDKKAEYRKKLEQGDTLEDRVEAISGVLDGLEALKARLKPVAQATERKIA